MRLQLQKRRHMQLHLLNVLVQQGIDPPTVLRGSVAQLQQHPDLVQCHVQGAAVTYELQALDVFVPVEPEVAAAACWFWQQALAFLITDG